MVSACLTIVDRSKGSVNCGSRFSHVEFASCLAWIFQWHHLFSVPDRYIPQHFCGLSTNSCSCPGRSLDIERADYDEMNITTPQTAGKKTRPSGDEKGKLQVRIQEKIAFSICCLWLS